MAKTKTQKRRPQSASRASKTPSVIVPPTNDQIFIYGLLLAATSMVVGVIWDISWDGSVGKDSFWTTAHMALNFGGLIAWIIAIRMTVHATRSGHPASVQVGLLRLPFGALCILWGGIAMLTYGTLDVWWSGAYGLMSGSWAAPQILVTAGIAAILIGTLLLTASRNNLTTEDTGEAQGAEGKKVWSTLWAAGLLLTFAATATVEINLPNLQRTALFYSVSCAVYPLILTWLAGTAYGRWPATFTALVYTGLVCMLIWILPLLPATPLIGPVYQQIDHMLPPHFPLLLIVPALVIDLIFQHVRQNDWIKSVLCGLLFTLVFMGAQWYFAEFLLSSAADNGLFAEGGRYWPFYMQVGPERTMFWGLEQSPVHAGTIFGCMLLAMASSRIGLWLGGWMGALQR